MNYNQDQILPLLNESFKDFFQRTYDLVKKKYPQNSFWLLENIGRRISYAGGEMDTFCIKPYLEKLNSDFKLAFSDSCETSFINNISVFYQKIIREYY